MTTYSIQSGTIASVDLATATATVRLAEGFVSDALPWISPAFGTTKVWLPPSVGDSVMVLCDADSLDHAVILPAVVAGLPAGFSPTQQGIRWADGVSVIASAGALSLTAPIVTINGNATINGSLNATGACIFEGKPFTSHTHSGVQTGGGSTGGVS